MPKGIFITLRDIQIIRGCSEPYASKIKHQYIDTLDLKRRELTIKEFCRMEEITTDEFNQAIENYYHKLTAKS